MLSRKQQKPLIKTKVAILLALQNKAEIKLPITIKAVTKRVQLKQIMGRQPITINKEIK